MCHVCGHTNHRTTMVHTFLESPSNLCIPGFVSEYSKRFRRNWRLKVHYTAMSCSRRGPLRYVCGQTINPTSMIYTFLESPTYLDVHPGKRFALFGRNRRNWCRQSRHKKQRNLLFAADLFTPTMFSTFIASLYILLAHGG